MSTSRDLSYDLPFVKMFFRTLLFTKHINGNIVQIVKVKIEQKSMYANMCCIASSCKQGIDFDYDNSSIYVERCRHFPFNLQFTRIALYLTHSVRCGFNDTLNTFL